jgi:hypothetical protein
MRLRIATLLRRLADRLHKSNGWDDHTWAEWGYPVDAVIEWEVTRDNLPPWTIEPITD